MLQGFVRRAWGFLSLHGEVPQRACHALVQGRQGTWQGLSLPFLGASSGVGGEPAFLLCSPCTHLPIAGSEEGLSGHPQVASGLTLTLQLFGPWPTCPLVPQR